MNQLESSSPLLQIVHQYSSLVQQIGARWLGLASLACARLLVWLPQVEWGFVRSLLPSLFLNSLLKCAMCVMEFDNVVKCCL